MHRLFLLLIAAMAAYGAQAAPELSLERSTVLFDQPGLAPSDAEFAPDGRSVMSWLETIKVFDPDGALLLEMDAAPGNAEVSHALALAPNGDVYAVVHTPYSGETADIDAWMRGGPILLKKFSGTTGERLRASALPESAYGYDGWELAVDNDGDVYVMLHAYNAPGYACRVIRLDSDLTTALGDVTIPGPAQDCVDFAVADDGSKVVWVVGNVEGQDFRTTDGARLNGPSDAFVARIDLSDSTRDFEYLIGGYHRETADAVAIAPDGSAIVTGYTNDLEMPARPGALQPTPNPVGIYVMRVGVDGTRELLTYLGGDHFDFPEAVEVAPDGSIYVGGRVEGFDLQGTPLAAQEYAAGSLSAFVAKLSPDGDTLDYLTHISGDAPVGGLGAINHLHSIRLHDDKLFVLGSTSAADFPISDGASGTDENWGSYFLSRLVPTSVYITGDSVLSTVWLDQPFEHQLSAAGGTGPYTFSMTAGSLSEGLTLDEDGRIHGTPIGHGALIGSRQFTVEVRDGTGARSLRTVIIVEVSSTPPSISADTPQPFPVIGQAYSWRISAWPFYGDTDWTLISGALPPGLALVEDTGEVRITGTPTTGGNHTFTLQVTDARGLSGSATFSIMVPWPNDTDGGGNDGNDGGGGGAIDMPVWAFAAVLFLRRRRTRR